VDALAIEKRKKKLERKIEVDVEIVKL